MANDVRRFEAKYQVDPETGCWIWMAASIARRDKSGHRYGMFNWGGRHGYAHRFACEVWRGPIPKGLTVDHRCRTTLCVNPFHLEVVTQAVNSQRGVMQRHPIVTGAANRRCRNGHWLDEADTYNDPRGFARCRACARERKHTGRPRGRPSRD